MVPLKKKNIPGKESPFGNPIFQVNHVLFSGEYTLSMPLNAFGACEIWTKHEARKISAKFDKSQVFPPMRFFVDSSLPRCFCRYIQKWGKALNIWLYIYIYLNVQDHTLHKNKFMSTRSWSQKTLVSSRSFSFNAWITSPSIQPSNISHLFLILIGIGFYFILFCLKFGKGILRNYDVFNGFISRSVKIQGVHVITQLVSCTLSSRNKA